MASPIVEKVLDRLDGEASLKILESNFDASRPKLWTRAKELAEERFGVYGVKAHSWAYKWYGQKGGKWEEIDEGVLGAASGAVLGGAVGGPLGAAAGAALGSKVDVLGKKKAKSPAAEEEKDRKDDKLFGSPNKKKDPNAEDKAAKAAKRERLARAIEKDKLDNAKAKIQKEHHQKDADGNEIPHEIVQELFGNKKYPYGKASKNNPRGKRDQAELDRAQAYIKKNPNFGKVSEAATTRIPAQNGNVYELMYSWRGKTYFCKMFFPQPGKPSKKEVQTALNQVYPSAILRNCVISAVNYGDPYIHAGKGDGFTGNATGY